MPLILTKENESEWLGNTLGEKELKRLMLPFAGEKMEAHTISRLITNRGTGTNTSHIKEKHINLN